MKLRIGIIALGLLAVIFIARNYLAQQMLEVYLTARTGHRVQVGQASVDLVSCSLALRNVRLYKSDEAAGDRLLELDRLNIDVQLKPLLKKKLRVKSMTAELAYLRLIRYSDGTTNLHPIADQLGTGKNKQGVATAPVPAASAAHPKPAAPPPSWIISNLNLNIGQVEITDYARGSTPTQLTLTLNARRNYQNITSLDQVLQPFSDDFLKSIVENKF